MCHVIEMTGKRFTKLLVLERRDSRQHGTNSTDMRAVWLCRCDCGNEIIAFGHSLRSGNTRSCGCIRSELSASATHRMTGTPEYRAWYSIKDRCNNPNNEDYHNYGGRGIKVCDRWSKFENFFSDMGLRPGGMSLDRQDVNGDYEPRNCRWATSKEQARNQRTNLRFTKDGKTRCLAEWCEMLGLNRALIYRRIRRGETFERAISRKARY